MIGVSNWCSFELESLVLFLHMQLQIVPKKNLNLVKIFRENSFSEWLERTDKQAGWQTHFIKDLAKHCPFILLPTQPQNVAGVLLLANLCSIIREPWRDATDQGQKYFLSFSGGTSCIGEVSVVSATTHFWVIRITLLQRRTYVKDAVAVISVQIDTVTRWDEVTIKVDRIRKINICIDLIFQSQDNDEVFPFQNMFRKSLPWYDDWVALSIEQCDPPAFKIQLREIFIWIIFFPGAGRNIGNLKQIRDIFDGCNWFQVICCGLNPIAPSNEASVKVISQVEQVISTG